MSNPITTAELKIIRERANIAACNGDTRPAVSIAREAIGAARWEAIDGPSTRDAIRAVDKGRRVARWWHPTQASL